MDSKIQIPSSKASERQSSSQLKQFLGLNSALTTIMYDKHFKCLVQSRMQVKDYCLTAVSVWRRPGVKNSRVEACMATSSFGRLATSRQRRQACMNNAHTQQGFSSLFMQLWCLLHAPVVIAPPLKQDGQVAALFVRVQVRSLCTNKIDVKPAVCCLLKLTPRWWSIFLVIHAHTFIYFRGYFQHNRHFFSGCLHS